MDHNGPTSNLPRHAVPDVDFRSSSLERSSPINAPSMDERTPLLGEARLGIPAPQGSASRNVMTPILYRRRWYILLLFSLLAFYQGFVWNTWGTIAASAELAFGWTDADIALQANWGAITYILSAIFFAWLMDVKGIRLACVLVAVLIFVATGIRCITSEPKPATWLINVASILNGFGGPVAMAASPLLSATWFPVDQRTTATAFACAMNGIGVGVSFVIGPLFVHFPSNSSQVDKLDASSSVVQDVAVSFTEEEFAFAALLLIAFVSYFPAKPPSPPSVTASIDRIQFLPGIKAIAKHRVFWLLGLAYAVSAGVYNIWTAVIGVNLKAFGISESTAGYIAFTGVMAGNVVAVIVSVFADMFARRMKSFLVVLYSVGSVAFCLFAMECAKYIPTHIAVFYACMIVGSICVSGAIPLLYELICEATYPIAEGLTNTCVTLLNNMAGLVFLLVLMIPMENKIWMNWTVFACTLVCVPVFLVYKPRYSRLELDIAAEKRC